MVADLSLLTMLLVEAINVRRKGIDSAEEDFYCARDKF